MNSNPRAAITDIAGGLLEKVYHYPDLHFPRPARLHFTPRPGREGEHDRLGANQQL